MNCLINIREVLSFTKFLKSMEYHYLCTLKDKIIMFRYIFVLIFLSASFTATGQTMTEKDYIRSGNKHYADSLFEKAEVDYRKALDLNPSSTDALYNLGNALFCQTEKTPAKAGEALSQYTTAAKFETDKERLAHIYHNIGVLMYAAQRYGESVAAYKESLRNNPTDHETRYNLAMAMHMNKQQSQEEQQNQEQQQEEQQQQQEQEQQQQEQQNQEQQQQEQNQEQQQQNQEQQNQSQQQQEQQTQQSKEEISKENAEQILNALMQDEKKLQEKQQKKMQQQQGKTLEKDW